MANVNDSKMIVGVVGAGAMGSGISQVAAGAGHHVVLSDAKAGATAKARDAMSAGLTKLVEKGKLDVAARDSLLARIEFVVPPLAVDFSMYRRVRHRDRGRRRRSRREACAVQCARRSCRRRCDHRDEHVVAFGGIARVGTRARRARGRNSLLQSGAGDAAG